MINFIIENCNNNINFKYHIDMCNIWGLLNCFILIPIIILYYYFSIITKFFNFGFFYIGKRLININILNYNNCINIQNHY